MNKTAADLKRSRAMRGRHKTLEQRAKMHASHVTSDPLDWQMAYVRYRDRLRKLEQVRQILAS